MSDGFKEYTLMHKNVPVACVTLDQVTGSLTAVGKLYAPAHLPVGISVRKGIVDRAALNEWWTGRSIPASRAGLRHVLEELGIAAPQKLLEHCLGLSLSDQYWIAPSDGSLRWEDINFFDNPFSGDVGELLFGGNVAKQNVDLMSPDNTSDGWLRKKWAIQNGKRCLIKGGSGAIQQEPYNEVIASRIMEQLGIPHVAYSLQMQQGQPYSVCEDFITPNTEFISAWYLLHTAAKPNHVSLYRHYLDRCEAVGIKGAERALAQQIVLDYLIANEDRHQGNFGVIRDADTLEFLCPAPIFDSGSSLWFETPTPQIRADARVACKPFKIIHEDQLRLVSDFGWLDLDSLTSLPNIVREIFAGSEFVDAARVEAIAKALETRAERLKEFVLSRPRVVDETAQDVRENVAYSGRSQHDKETFTR